jgi:hypothetical protein
VASKPFVTVDVKGLPQLKRGTAELTEKIGETAGERLFRVAEHAGQDVSAKVPRKTGRFAGSVRSTLAKSERKSSVRIGGRVPYAGWLEFGGTRGRPYIKQGRWLYPTALAAEPQAVRAADDAAKDEIGRMRWPKPTS